MTIRAECKCLYWNEEPTETKGCELIFCPLDLHMRKRWKEGHVFDWDADLDIADSEKFEEWIRGEKERLGIPTLLEAYEKYSQYGTITPKALEQAIMAGQLAPPTA